EIRIGTSYSRQPELRDVLKHKDHIKSVRIFNTCQQDTLTSTIWETIMQLTQLKSLSMENLYVDEGTVDFIWDLCERVEQLGLWQVSFATLGNLDSRKPFSRVRHLDLRNAKLDQRLFSDNVELLKRCPNMEFLIWPEKLRRGKVIDGFIQLAVDGTWPALESVWKFYFPISDDNQARVLRSMKRITGWNVRWFGPKGFQVLRHHFTTLKELHLSGCKDGVTSEMLQEVLSSCPLLVTVSWARINAVDIVCGRPWVCTKMEDLDMTIVFDPEETDRLQPLVFEQLSKLTALEYLDLSGRAIAADMDSSRGGEDEDLSDIGDSFHRYAKLMPYKRSIDLRLEMGLDKLATLRLLKRLRFLGTTQRIGKDEVEWMLKNWKCLNGVRGRLDGNQDANAELVEMLTKQGISCVYR
ncbi:hypothetical protein BGZ98_000322, partial [Dissophora globulifera]